MHDALASLAPVEVPPTLSDLANKGFQHLPSFFSETEKSDFRLRAQEIIAAREAGTLTTFDQDSRGFSNDWYMPLLHHPAIVALAISVLGENVCGKGWRILAKDKHFNNAIHIHQDWPYNPGGDRKLSIFIPLTRVNKINGGLHFLERSHFIGPVSRGPLDRSKFPQLKSSCPDIDVGDIIVCDFLTWHYSEHAESPDERIMIQLNYQPATDPSSKHVVAGVLPHEFLLENRFDAAVTPSVELNCAEARKHYERGAVDKAERYARGLLYDDPEHAGAALLLYDILDAAKSPEALQWLEAARASATRVLRAVSARDADFNEGAPVTGLEPEASEPASSPWRAVAVDFSSYVEGVEGASSLPAVFATPEIAWNYGAIATPAVAMDRPATLRVRAQALEGAVGICLLQEDCSTLASEPHVITPDDGRATVMIAIKPERAPVHLLIRNHDEQGRSGQVRIDSVEIVQIG